MSKIEFSDLEAIEIDGINTWDYPDFADAFILYAEIDGKALTVKQLSLKHISRCRRIERCRSRWSPYH